MTSPAVSFDELWNSLLPIGRTSHGGYRRFAWTAEDAAARAWFLEAATSRGLHVERDRNANLWAWWLPPGGSPEQGEAFVAGSHLDSVPDGGAFDGPLGVVSALCAIDTLKARGIVPAKPLAVAVFSDEEGARFGMACVGSRLLTGVLEPARARALTDAAGVTLEQAMRASGIDATALGRDDELLSRIGVYVELHIEQGRSLADSGHPIGVGTSIWPHGRWRLTFAGRPDHAGTTRLADRHDPMLPLAATVLAAREAAAVRGGLATVGRVVATPNATNGIAARVDAWLDARARDDETLDALLDEVNSAASVVSREHGVTFGCVTESLTPRVDFAADTRAWLHEVVGAAPDLSTGAGHDAGVLAAELPSGMVFVRNPTGVSHAPNEFAERDDCLAGVEALSRIMAGWIAA